MLNVLEEKIGGAVLTKTQKRIAAYFLRNQERIGNLASLEVAREIGVSDASIIRFSRQIGYAGFSDLKKDIYENLAQSAAEGIRVPNLTERLDAADHRLSGASLRDAFSEMMTYNLKRSLFSNKQEDYEAAVRHIYEANKKVVMGFHGCKGVALQFSRLLSTTEANVTLIPSSDPDNYSFLQSLGSGDVAVVFGFPRHFKIDVDFVRCAKERGATVVVVTDNVLAPYAEYADVLLIATTDHMSFFNSQIGASCIGEYLITMLTRMYDRRSRLEEKQQLSEPLFVKE